jgi:hypothetical protein
VIQELLVQSFLPNIIHIFPIPQLFLTKESAGELRGLALPGNSEIVSLKWKESSQIESMVVEVDLNHFWWRQNRIQEKKDRPGFYHWSSSPSSSSDTEQIAEITFITPGRLEVISTAKGKTDICQIWKKQEESPEKNSKKGNNDYLSVISRGKTTTTFLFNLKDAKNQKKCQLIFAKG